ncbi:MAG TPA: hypothetical protein VE343_02470, partial [Streptosporangiaceae bacterium]|nr:hypothetical protein [Streptosporangiaceae bacterium]
IATGPGTRPLTGRQPGQLQPARLRPGDYADVLPPVAWGGGPAVAGRPAEADVPAAAAGSPGGYKLLAMATMVTVVAASVILPVAGALVALALIVLLRAGESATRGRILRRSARGQRASDPLVSVVSYPWFLVRSALACAVVAPIALVVAALVAGITFVLVRVDTLPRAIAYATGTLVAFYALGPGSRGARRQLTRIYATAARGRALQAALLIVVGALATATVAAALTSPSLYWPVSPPRNLLHLALSHVAATHPALPHAPPPQKLLRDAVRLVFSHLSFW